MLWIYGFFYLSRSILHRFPIISNVLCDHNLLWTICSTPLTPVWMVFTYPGLQIPYYMTSAQPGCSPAARITSRAAFSTDTFSTWISPQAFRPMRTHSKCRCAPEVVGIVTGYTASSSVKVCSGGNSSRHFTSSFRGFHGHHPLDLPGSNVDDGDTGGASFFPTVQQREVLLAVWGIRAKRVSQFLQSV